MLLLRISIMQSRYQLWRNSDATLTQPFQMEQPNTAKSVPHVLLVCVNTFVTRVRPYFCYLCASILLLLVCINTLLLVCVNTFVTRVRPYFCYSCASRPLLLVCVNTFVTRVRQYFCYSCASILLLLVCVNTFVGLAWSELANFRLFSPILICLIWAVYVKITKVAHFLCLFFNFFTKKIDSVTVFFSLAKFRSKIISINVSEYFGQEYRGVL
jgi:hypothetical protein